MGDLKGDGASQLIASVLGIILTGPDGSCIRVAEGIAGLETHAQERYRPLRIEVNDPMRLRTATHQMRPVPRDLTIDFFAARSLHPQLSAISTE